MILILVGVIGWLYPPFHYHIRVVEPGKIYRSGQMRKDGLKYVVNHYHIASIVNLRRAHPEEPWYQDEMAVVDQYNLHHYNVSIPSHHMPTRKRLVKMAEDIKDIFTPVLCYCRYGADRAGFASAVSLILREDAPMKQALKQFSWRYLVVRPDNIGKLVMPYYQR